MPLQNNVNNEYSEIPLQLLERFPNFQSLFDIDDGVYILFGDFYHNYILKNIDNITVMKEVCDFINELLAIEYYAIKELIQIQIFEHCLYDNRILKLLEEYLNDDSKKYLYNFLNNQ